MDYAGGYSGEQSAQLASSIESLNGTIAGLKDTVANMGSTMHRNVTQTLSTAGSFGTGAFNNAYSAVAPALAPQVMEIMPGAFQRPPGGLLHNMAAAAGVVGQSGTPWGFEMSNGAYQDRARERVGKSLGSMYSNVMETFWGSNPASFAADLVTTGVTAGASVLGTPAMGFAAGAVAAYGTAYLENKMTGPAGYSYRDQHALYNRSTEVAGMLQGMNLGSKEISEIDANAYGSVGGKAIMQASKDLGTKKGWFGFDTMRALDSDISASLQESGVMQQILGDEGKVEKDFEKFGSQLKEKSKAMVKLAERLDIDYKEAWQMIAKINEVMGAKPGAEQQATIDNFMGNINKGANAMNMAPMQAYDYMSRMQNIYQTTGLMSKEYWSDASVRAMQYGGAVGDTGGDKVEGLNKASKGVAGITAAFRDGVFQDAFTRSIAADGAAGERALTAALTEAEALKVSGTDASGKQTAEIFKKYLGEYSSPERLLAGVNYADSDGRVAQIKEIASKTPAGQMMLNNLQDEALLKESSFGETVLPTMIATRKRDLMRTGSFASEKDAEIAAKVDIEKTFGYDALYDDSPAGIENRRKANAAETLRSSLDNLSFRYDSKPAWYRFNEQNLFAPTQAHVKNISSAVTAGDIAPTDLQDVLSAGSPVDVLKSSTMAMRDMERSYSKDLSGIRDMPFSIKKELFKGASSGANLEYDIYGKSGDAFFASNRSTSDSVSTIFAETALAARSGGGLEGMTMDEVRQAMAKTASKRSGVDMNTAYQEINSNVSDSVISGLLEKNTAERLSTYEKTRDALTAVAAADPKQIDSIGRSFKTNLEGALTAEERGARIAAGAVYGGIDTNTREAIRLGMLQDSAMALQGSPLAGGINFRNDNESVALSRMLGQNKYADAANILARDVDNSTTIPLADIGKSESMNDSQQAAAALMRMYQVKTNPEAATAEELARVNTALESKENFAAFLGPTDKGGIGINEDLSKKLQGIYSNFGGDGEISGADSRGLLEQGLGAVASGAQERSFSDIESAGAAIADKRTAEAANSMKVAFDHLYNSLTTITHAINNLYH